MKSVSSRPRCESHPVFPTLPADIVVSRRTPAAMAWIILIVALVPVGVSRAALATFEDLPLPPESYWNGADGSGGFHSGGASLKNNHYYDAEADVEWWDGFVYSNRTDTSAQGAAGQYNAITGSGQGKSKTYAVGYIGWKEPPTLTLSTPQILQGLYVTNDNYTYYDMRNGGLFSKQFGGSTRKDDDWLKLSITGLDTTGNVSGTVDFYLADFRFEDNQQDYLVNAWEFVDLTSLGAVKTLQFALTSSDMDPEYGMNTPGYFALDTVVPEPATVLLLGLGTLFALRHRGRR